MIYCKLLRRVNELKPRMVLDHLVKERYPRFIDALRDMDDCLCMIHLFAALPSAGRITADRTSACAKLAREWQYYVSKSRSLRKVFVSVKGIYYQAEIMGETISWLVPHAFTQHIPQAVDFRVMVTFMEFYEIFFKFVLFKLYHKQGWQYPPVVDERLDHAGCCLLAMKSDSNGAKKVTVTSKAETKPNKTEASSSSSNLVASVDSEKFQGNLKTLPTLLKNISNDDSDDEEDELAISAPLSAAFSDLQRSSVELDEDENDREIFQHNNDAAVEDKRMHLFSKLTFFVNREVPLSVMQLCLTAFGGRVSWEGPDAPFKNDDRSITHHILDRPIQAQTSTAARQLPREYIQPQWIFDSINAEMLLPTRLYAPGAKLPPHLSPFVDDEKEGYMPRYREEVQKLQVEAGVLEATVASTSSTAKTSHKKPANTKVVGKKRAAIDMDEDGESDTENEEEDEDESEEGVDEDEGSNEEETEELLEVPLNKNNGSKISQVQSSSGQKQPESNTTKGPKAIVKKTKNSKQSEVLSSFLNIIKYIIMLCVPWGRYCLCLK